MSSEQTGAATVAEERRYAKGGKVAHVVEPNALDHMVLVSRCGISARSWWWRGTGDQAEYERVASLPLCRNCERWPA